jgi:hypothetical protein
MVAGKSVRAATAKPAAKKARLSKAEAEGLAKFKAVLAKYAGKCTFAGSDE